MTLRQPIFLSAITASDRNDSVSPLPTDHSRLPRQSFSEGGSPFWWILEPNRPKASKTEGIEFCKSSHRPRPRGVQSSRSGSKRGQNWSKTGNAESAWLHLFDASGG